MKLIRLLRDQRGTTVVEFAVLSPVIFSLFFAGFDFGYTLYMQSVLQGAVNKAARDSTLETSTVTTAQNAIDQKVRDQVNVINQSATVDFTRAYFRTYADAATPTAETYNDTNSNGKCDNNEIYVDKNGNGQYDKTTTVAGQGGTRDAVVYTATLKYDRVFPLAGLLGWSNQVTLKSSTVLANQPYGERGDIQNRKCTP